MKKIKKVFPLIITLLAINPEIAFAIKYVSCGNDRRLPLALANIVSTFMTIIKVAVPILLVIGGMISFFKATMSSNVEEDLKKSKNKLVNSIIAAVVIFFVISIINFAVSSLNISKDNNITLLSFKQEELDEEEEEGETNLNNIINTQINPIKLKSQVKCEFPVSSILFSPHEENKNLLISTSDILSLYSYEEEQLNLKVAFKRRTKDYNGPLTSSDWSRANKAIIGVSSVDGTCSIWDLNKLVEKYMIIAHDKEVYDISLGQDEFIFMSTGADGSVRLFDSRTANSVNILFETKKKRQNTIPAIGYKAL
jgi:WD40 repeat protein